MENQGKGGCLGVIALIVIVGTLISSCQGHSDSDYINKAHTAVLDQLKSPSTASWCNDDSVSDSPAGGGDKIVTGCVNAQNEFGATVEIDYAVYEDKDTNVNNTDVKQRQ